MISRHFQKSPSVDSVDELFFFFMVGVFIMENWIFVNNVSTTWVLFRIFFSVLSLLPILLISTERGANLLKCGFGTKNIGLKLCSLLTLLIGLYVILGKISYKGFYLLMGIKIAGNVYKYTPFAFILIFGIFFMISNVRDKIDQYEKVKINDIMIVILIILLIFPINFVAELENSFISLLNKKLHPGITAGIFFTQFITHWLYVNLPLVIFFVQRNYDRSIFGFTFRLTWRDIKTILKGMLLFIGLIILIGLVSERMIYIPYDRLSLKLWVNKIYYALFMQGLTEEFIYRALMLTVIDKLLREKNYKNGSIIAVLISALVYALSYWRAGIVSILTMFLVGMVLSYSYYSTKKFAVPVLLNAFWITISSEWSKVVL